MFKKIAFSLMCCTLLVAAKAQTDDYTIPSPDQQPVTPQPPVATPANIYRPQMELGLSGGGGVSILYNNQPLQNPRTPGKSPYTSTAFGVSYQYNFPKIISIRAELNMQRTGDEMFLTHTTNLTSDGQLQNITNYGYDKLNYMTLPVMVRLSVGKRVQFFTDLGVYAGLLFNAERVTSTTYFTQPGQVETETGTTSNISQGVRQLDGGIVTGVGINVPIWKGVAFSFEARNNVGLANINANNMYYGNKLYNDNVNFLAGLNFFLANNTKKSSDRLINLK